MHYVPLLLLTALASSADPLDMGTGVEFSGQLNEFKECSIIQVQTLNSIGENGNGLNISYGICKVTFKSSDIILTGQIVQMISSQPSGPLPKYEIGTKCAIYYIPERKLFLYKKVDNISK